MARKLERHMPLKLRLLGKCFVATGVILLMVLTFLWSQYLFPTMLDAHVAFDVRSYRAYLGSKLDRHCGNFTVSRRCSMSTMSL